MSITDCSTTETGKGRTYKMFCKSISTKKVVNNPTIEEIITDLNNYKTENVKKTIDTLLLRLSIAVKKLGGKINTENNKTIVDSIKDSLPDPDNKGTTINTSERKLEKIIKTITDIVNDDIFTTSVIENQKQCYEIVRDINQYLYDLSCSINSELEYIKNIITTILDKFSSTKSVGLIKKIETSISIIDEHQISIDKELKQHLSKYDKINEDIETEDLELHCNSIARILGSVKHLAVIAYLYDTIIGVVSSEFPNIKEINKEIKRLSRLTKKDKHLEKTVNSIKNYFYKRKITGGAMNFDLVSESDNSSLLGGSINEPGQFLEGGAIEVDGLTPEQIERNKKIERAKVVIREYVAEMNVDINEFIEHVYEASKYMGVTTYDVNQLKDHLEDMKWIEGLREPNIYLSMVGYHLDDSYRTMSAQYEDRLKKTARGLKDLGKAIPGTSTYLNKASSNVMNIIKTVDHFKDLLKTLLVGVCLADIRDVVGEVPHAMGNIGLALNRLYHSLNIAQMRKMISRTSKDLCNYSKNYPELLALVVGARRADLEREYQILVADCPVGQNQRIDPLTGRILNPTTGANVNLAAPLPGESLEDAEARTRVISETITPGGISMQMCSLSWKYKNLSNTACNWRGNVAIPAVGPGDLFAGGAVQPDDEGRRKLETLLRSPKYLENFTKLLREIEGEFRAKHRLYKSMESLDLLLSSFTKEIAGDIDLMKEVKHYLEDTKVYTKWFTDYTGDLLVSVFEGMPAYVNYAQPNIADLGNNPPTEKLDKYLSGPENKRTVYKFTPPRQDYPARYQNYVGTTEYNSLSEDLKNPVCISFYYKQLAKTIYQAGGLPVYGKATGVACMKGAGKVRKTIDEFYNNFQALKNIFHSFITLYNRIISKGVRSKALMSPSQIYYSILSYLKQSALARRLQPGDERCHNQCEGTIGFVTPEKKDYPQNIPYRSHWYTSLVGMILPGYYPTGQEFGCYSIQDRTGYPTSMVNQKTGNLKRFNEGVNVVAPYERGPANSDLGDAYPLFGYPLTGAVVPDGAFETASGLKLINPPVRGIAPPADLENDINIYTNVPLEGAGGALTQRNFVTTAAAGGITADKAYRNNVSNTYKSVYEVEDRLCAMGIKSITSVVLSCMGLFTIQQQPVNMGLQKAVRSIVGGGESGDDKKVEGGLLSLTSTLESSIRDPNIAKVNAKCDLYDAYYYVTRLAEFYAIIFKKLELDDNECKRDLASACATMQQTANTDPRYECRIRLPVDLDSEFGKILYVVANATPQGSSSNFVYGEKDTAIIINEVNKLSNKYKKVDDIIAGLVLDVNRKFSCLVDEEAQMNFVKLEGRLTKCPDTPLGNFYCRKSVCGKSGKTTTGEMPFENEHEDDSDISYLDDAITPSDALINVTKKYTAFTAESSGCRPSSVKTIEQERMISKINFCGEYKLFHKLARLRTLIDEMFDEYLRTDYDKCRRGDKPISLKKFPLSTEFYKSSFHQDFVDRMKETCKKARGSNQEEFGIAVSLINSKGRGTVADKKGANKDTLFAFTETVGLMTSNLFNTKQIIETCLNDLTVFSGEAMFDKYRDTTILQLIGDIPGDDGDRLNWQQHGAAVVGIAPAVNAGTAASAANDDIANRLLRDVLYHELISGFLDALKSDNIGIANWRIEASDELTGVAVGGNNSFMNAIAQNVGGAGGAGRGIYERNFRQQLAAVVPGLGNAQIPGMTDVDGLKEYLTSMTFSGMRVGAGYNPCTIAVANIGVLAAPAVAAPGGLHDFWLINNDPATLKTRKHFFYPHEKLFTHISTAPIPRTFKKLGDLYKFKTKFDNPNEGYIENIEDLLELYYLIISMIMDQGGIKLLGINWTDNTAHTIKDAIISIWKCSPEKRPHNIAIAKILKGQYQPGYVDPAVAANPAGARPGYQYQLNTSQDNYDALPKYIQRALIVETINQVLYRFDLSALQATAMGTIARLSSSLDGLVSTTISNQGTYLDMTPIQNLSIDCLGMVKEYASRFYDVLPNSAMEVYYKRSEPDSGGNRESIYDIEYDITKIFEPHIINEEKRFSLVNNANQLVTAVHKSLIVDNIRNVFTNTNVNEANFNNRENYDFNTVLGDYRLRPFPPGGAAGAGVQQDSTGIDVIIGESIAGINGVVAARLYPRLTKIVPYTASGNSIMSSIMPNHFEPLSINVNEDFVSIVPSTGAFTSSINYYKILHVFTAGNVKKDPTKPYEFVADPCLAQVCSDIRNMNLSDIYVLDSLSNGTHLESLIPALNYGIRSMLVSFYDYGNRKIYKGILDMFMTDKLSNNIENLNTSYPDITLNDTAGAVALYDSIMAKHPNVGDPPDGAPPPPGPPAANVARLAAWNARNDELTNAGFNVPLGRNALSRNQVAGKKTLLDADRNKVHYAIPKSEALLCTSVALLLRLFFNSNNMKSGASQFVFDSLAEIKNVQLVEVMKLKLPMFREYFIKLANKCKVIRAFLTKGCGDRTNKRRLVQTELPCARRLAQATGQHELYGLNPTVIEDAYRRSSINFNCVKFDKRTLGEKITAASFVAKRPQNFLRDAVTVGAGDDPKYPINLQYVIGGQDGTLADSELYGDGTSNEFRYGYFMDLISGVEDSAISIANSCETILNEFTDEDKYMIPSLGYIENHKKKYSNPTFRPLSLISAFTSNAKHLRELHSLTNQKESSSFKLQFGAKGILFSDDMKFANSKYIDPMLCAIRNNTKSSLVKVDTNYTSFIKNYLQLFRFNYSVLNYSQLSVTPGNYASAVVDDNKFQGGDLELTGGEPQSEAVLIQEHFERNYNSNLGITDSPAIDLESSQQLAIVQPFINRNLPVLHDKYGRVLFSSSGFTIERMSKHSTWNLQGRYLAEKLINWIESGDANVKTETPTVGYDFTNEQAQNILRAFDAGAGPKVFTYFSGLYNLHRKGEVNTPIGRSKCEMILNNMCPHVVRNLTHQMNVNGDTTRPNININHYQSVVDYLSKNTVAGIDAGLASADFNNDTNIALITTVLGQAANARNAATGAEQRYRMVLKELIDTLARISGTVSAILPLSRQNPPAPAAGPGAAGVNAFGLPAPEGVVQKDIDPYVNAAAGAAGVPDTFLSQFMRNLINAPASLDQAANSTGNWLSLIAVLAEVIMNSTLLLTLAQGVAAPLSDHKQTVFGTLDGMMNLPKPGVGAFGVPGAFSIIDQNKSNTLIPGIQKLAGVDRPLTQAQILNVLEDLNQPDSGAVSGGLAITGGSINYDNMYSLLKTLGGYKYIYTTNPNTSPEFLLDLINGDDIEEKLTMITDGMTKGSDIDTDVSCGTLSSSVEPYQQKESLISLLIEKNINPINVHAMQRFIPFANIYNYSYSLDRFAYTMFNIPILWGDLVHAGFGKSQIAPTRDEQCTKPGQQIICFKNIFRSTDPTYRPGRINPAGNQWQFTNQPGDMSQIDVSSSYYRDITKEIFIRLLMDPYAHVDQFAYGSPTIQNKNAAYLGPVLNILRGQDNLGMGVPKFLSDQVLSKSLFSSTYVGGKTRMGGPQCPQGDFQYVDPGAGPAVTATPAMGARVGRVAALGGAGDRLGRFAHEAQYPDNSEQPVGNPPIGTDTQIHDFEHELVNTTSDLFGQTFITDTGTYPEMYQPQRMDSDSSVMRALPFYDPDHRKVQVYDLCRVFQPPIPAGVNEMDDFPMSLYNVAAGYICSADGSRMPSVTPATDAAAGLFAPGVDGDQDRKRANLIEMFWYEGYERFNTQLVRNVTFISNLQRLMRYSLNMWLTRAYGAVSRGHKALSAEVTERRYGDAMSSDPDEDYDDVQQSWI